VEATNSLSRIIKSRAVKKATHPAVDVGRRSADPKPFVPEFPEGSGPRPGRGPSRRRPAREEHPRRAAQPEGAQARPSPGADPEAARREADNMLQHARQEAENLARQARQQGFEAGKREGLEAARLEARRMLEEASAVLAEARREKARRLAGLEADVVRLAVAVARSIIGETVEARPETVLHSLRAAIARLTEEEELVVRVNPRDAGLAEAERGRWLAGARAQAKVEIIRDPAVEPGGCVVESQHGVLDASLSERMANLERALIEEVVRDG